MEKKNPARIEWIDYLKGIGIILVLIGHCYLPPDLRKVIYCFHMPLFFFAGGLTLNFEKYPNPSSFIKKKAAALLVPYFAINLSTMASWILFNKILGDSEVSLGRLLYGIVYANNDKIPMVNGVTWFIPALFLAEVALYYLWKLCEKNMGVMFAVSCAMVVLGYAVSIVSKEIRPWHISSVPVALSFVFTGYWFAQTYKADGYRKIREKTSWLWIAGLYLVGLAAQYYNGKVSFGGNKYKAMDLTMIAAYCMIFATVFLCMKIPKSRFLSFAGVSSLSLLALHKPVIFGIRHIWPGTKEYYLASFKGMLVLFAVVIPASWLVEKYFPFVIGRDNRKMLNRAAAVIWGIFTVALCVIYF